MPTKAYPVIGLCLLLLAACGGAPMEPLSGGGGSGSSGSNPTSYESGYGVTSGSSDSTLDGEMDWSE